MTKHGPTLVEQAIELANENPLDLGDDLELEAKTYRHFVCVLGYLQVITGPKPFYISQKSFGELLNVPPRHISHIIPAAIADGFICKTKDHIPRCRAAEFTFDIDRVPSLAGYAKRKAAAI